MRFIPLVILACVLTACGGGETDTKAADSPRLETQQSGSASQSADRDASTPENTSGGYSSSFILNNPDGINQLTWEDLMPEGEEAVLALLYEEFYTDLETRLRAQSQRLKDVEVQSADGSDLDISQLIAEGSASDTMEQIGTFNVVEDLDGLKIRLPGYVVPLDFSSNKEYKEFLLVPYFGACLHTPPPPPNQIVYVKSDPAAEVESIYDPVWVEGTLRTGKFENETGNSAYELTLSKIEVYEY